MGDPTDELSRGLSQLKAQVKAMALLDSMGPAAETGEEDTTVLGLASTGPGHGRRAGGRGWEGSLLCRVLISQHSQEVLMSAAKGLWQWRHQWGMAVAMQRCHPNPNPSYDPTVPVPALCHDPLS